MNELFNIMLMAPLFSMFEDKDNDVETVDLTTKEGYEIAKKAINDALKNPFVTNFFSDDLLKKLNKKVDDIYKEANPKLKVKINEMEPAKPSERCTPEQKQSINALVDEYINTIIKPSINFNEDITTSIKNGLYEFACWIINHK